tara:strand:- start:1912 stop:2154 length:243 start_codon:yes stop_codon:yes gene_type:complete
LITRTEFPLELFYPIKDNPQYELLICVGLEESKGLFWVETTILFKESKKIFKVLGKKFNLETVGDAKSFGLKLYSDFVRN